ncbi:MAG: hypothetical protein PF590_00375 [Candidatus Delongbacteria bacterium]|jgi:hypothetical protein|nr:hypothetical protein [Candidatus Delongbacteria bacterium]
MKTVHFFIITISFLLMVQVTAAQEKSAGIRFGIPEYIYNISEGNEEFKLMPAFFHPKIEAFYHSGINETIFWEGSFGYYEPGMSIGAEIMFFDELVTQHFSENHFKAISCSGSFGAQYNLLSDLYLGLQTGMSGDYYFDPTINSQNNGGWIGDTYTSSFIDENALRTNFNILLNNRLSFIWKTGFNMNFSLSGAYYTGLFYTWKSKVYFKLAKSENSTVIYSPTLSSRGSYWLIDIGVAWVF